MIAEALGVIYSHPWWTTLWILIMSSGFVRIRIYNRGD